MRIGVERHEDSARLGDGDADQALDAERGQMELERVGEQLELRPEMPASRRRRRLEMA